MEFHRNKLPVLLHHEWSWPLYPDLCHRLQVEASLLMAPHTSFHVPYIRRRYTSNSIQHTFRMHRTMSVHLHSHEHTSGIQHPGLLSDRQRSCNYTSHSLRANSKHP